MKFNSPYTLTRRIPATSTQGVKNHFVEGFGEPPSIQQVSAVASRSQWPTGSILQLQEATDSGYRIIKQWTEADIEQELMLAQKEKDMQIGSYRYFHSSCYGLSGLSENSIDALATDPPYGISFKGCYWDKDLPNPSIWEDCLRVLKPGAYGVVFSSIRLQHRLTVHLEDAGFQIKDVLLWGFLNGMPKSRDLGLEIDKVLGVESQAIGQYRYVQGYTREQTENYLAGEVKAIKVPTSELGKRYKGFGSGIKPAYEPIILVQKPFKGTIAENIISYGVGGINLEETRIPYAEDDGRVGHNPHPNGRVMANILRDEPFEDGYDKFFLVPKVRQGKDDFNTHPTIKPTQLMEQLIKLISAKGQTVLDPFMGSGSTGVAALQCGRNFIGYELEDEYIEISRRRLEAVVV